MATTNDQVLATPEDIADTPRRQVREHAGIHERVLWSGGTQVSGIMDFSPGAGMPEHAHTAHSHHVWIVEGSIDVLGHALSPGSYAYVPPGVAHRVTAGPDGCTLFYVFTE